MNDFINNKGECIQCGKMYIPNPLKLGSGQLIRNWTDESHPARRELMVWTKLKELNDRVAKLEGKKEAVVGVTEESKKSRSEAMKAAWAKRKAKNG